jgi:hypothetical protein
LIVIARPYGGGRDRESSLHAKAGAGQVSPIARA